MARYTGPKTKIARKFGEPIFGSDKAFEKRNYPPGQHGVSKRRGKKSEYSIQLMEKQKAKFTYGILERQFRNLFDKASRSKGVTGEVLLQLCESRLDNLVYRFGLSPSRSGARQLVSHRHITVNGSVVNIPSYQVQATDKISVRSKCKDQSRIQFAMSVAETRNPSDWIDVDSKNLSATYLRIPERSELPKEINESLIVELYSK